MNYFTVVLVSLLFCSVRGFPLGRIVSNGRVPSGQGKPGKPGKPGKGAVFRKCQGKPGKVREFL